MPRQSMNPAALAISRNAIGPIPPPVETAADESDYDSYLTQELHG
jgi:hypothetical protein